MILQTNSILRRTHLIALEYVFCFGLALLATTIVQAQNMKDTSLSLNHKGVECGMLRVKGGTFPINIDDFIKLYFSNQRMDQYIIDPRQAFRFEKDSNELFQLHLDTEQIVVELIIDSVLFDLPYYHPYYDEEFSMIFDTTEVFGKQYLDWNDSLTKTLHLRAIFVHYNGMRLYFDPRDFGVFLAVNTQCDNWPVQPPEILFLNRCIYIYIWGLDIGCSPKHVQYYTKIAVDLNDNSIHTMVLKDPFFKLYNWFCPEFNGF